MKNWKSEKEIGIIQLKSKVKSEKVKKWKRVNKAEMSGSNEIQMQKHIALVYEDMETNGLAEFCDNFVYAGAGYQLAMEECYNDFGPLKATLKRIIQAKEAAQEAEAMRHRFEGKQQETLSRKRSCSESFHEEEDDNDDDDDNEAEADIITRTSEPPQFASALLEYYQLPNSIFI